MALCRTMGHFEMKHCNDKKWHKHINIYEILSKFRFPSEQLFLFTLLRTTPAHTENNSKLVLCTF